MLLLVLYTDPKAKKVQQQTLRLLHNMQQQGELSRRHGTIRRRIMEDAKETGKDHVLKVAIMLKSIASHELHDSHICYAALMYE